MCGGSGALHDTAMIIKPVGTLCLEWVHVASLAVREALEAL